MNSVLPLTWRRVRLGDICEINPRLPSGVNLTDDSKVTFLPMAAIDEMSGQISRLDEKHYREVKIGFTPFCENDVLFAKITPCMENGKAIVAKNILNGVGFGSTEFHVLRCSDQVLSDYVFYFIRQPSFRKWAKSSFIGSAGQQRVPADFLKRVTLLLPSLPEQHSIIEILKQADSLRTQRQEVLEQIQQIPTALFLEMFGDPVSSPHHYIMKPLARLGKLDRGISKHRPRDAVHLYGGNYPFIQTGDVSNSGGWISSFSQTYSDVGLRQSRLWPSGTLCITIAANIAKTGILEFDACFPDSVVGFLAGEEVTSEYVMVAINLWQKILETQAPQAAQKNINLKILRELRIPVPPIDEQLRFSSLLKECRKLLITHEELASESLETENYLRAAAFSGELTQSWRESHQTEIQAWLREQKEKMPQKSSRVVFQENVPSERTVPTRPTRRWLMNQLSDMQFAIYTSLKEWKGTLIPSEDLDAFIEQWFTDHLRGEHNHVLCALDQLAGLGLIACISVQNQAGDYVTAFRVLREEELSKTDDLERLEAQD